jgi:hypothetical protein
MVRDFLLNIRYPRRGKSNPYSMAKNMDGPKSAGNATPPTGEGNLYGADIMKV